MRVVLGASVLATVAGCGGAKKADPYAASLAKGSEHVEIRGSLKGEIIVASGDFTNQAGHMTILNRTGQIDEVVAGHRIYLNIDGKWVTGTSPGFLTPSQVFQKRLPATIEHGLVKSVVLRDAHGSETITFSKYGEHVSVNVPRVKGTAK